MREIHHLALMEGDMLLTPDGDPVGEAVLVTSSGDVTRVAFASGIEATFSGDDRVFIADEEGRAERIWRDLLIWHDAQTAAAAEEDGSDA